VGKPEENQDILTNVSNSHSSYFSSLQPHSLLHNEKQLTYTANFTHLPTNVKGKFAKFRNFLKTFQIFPDERRFQPKNAIILQHDHFSI